MSQRPPRWRCTTFPQDASEEAPLRHPHIQPNRPVRNGLTGRRRFLQRLHALRDAAHCRAIFTTGAGFSGCQHLGHFGIRPFQRRGKADDLGRKVLHLLAQLRPFALFLAVAAALSGIEGREPARNLLFSRASVASRASSRSRSLLSLATTFSASTPPTPVNKGDSCAAVRSASRRGSPPAPAPGSPLAASSCTPFFFMSSRSLVSSRSRRSSVSSRSASVDSRRSSFFSRSASFFFSFDSASTAALPSVAIS